jgi:hypothetical protein
LLIPLSFDATAVPSSVLELPLTSDFFADGATLDSGKTTANGYRLFYIVPFSARQSNNYHERMPIVLLYPISARRSQTATLITRRRGKLSLAASFNEVLTSLTLCQSKENFIEALPTTNNQDRWNRPYTPPNPYQAMPPSYSSICHFIGGDQGLPIKDLSTE